MRMKATQTPRDMVSALECVLAILDMGRGGRGARSTMSLANTTARPLGFLGGAQEDHLPQLSPWDETMPTEAEHHPASRPFKPWLA